MFSLRIGGTQTCLDKGVNMGVSVSAVSQWYLSMTIKGMSHFHFGSPKIPLTKLFHISENLHFEATRICYPTPTPKGADLHATLPFQGGHSFFTGLGETMENWRRSGDVNLMFFGLFCVETIRSNRFHPFFWFLRKQIHPVKLTCRKSRRVSHLEWTELDERHGTNIAI